MLSSFRHLVAGVLVLVAAGGIVVGLTARRAHDELMDSPAFAGSAREALEEDQEVRDALAAVLARRLVQQVPQAGAGGPAGPVGERVLAEVAEAVVATDAFADVFAAAVEDAHASVLDHPGGEVVLDLSGSARIVGDRLGRAVPAAAALPDGALAGIRVGSGTQLPDLSRADDLVEAASTLGLLIGIVALAAAVVLSPSPWGVAAAAGIFVAVGAGLVWLLVAVGPDLALTRLPDADLRTVADGVVEEAVAGVRFQAGATALVAAAVGVVGLVMGLRPRRAVVV